MDEDPKKCSKCKMISSETNFLKTLLKKIVKDLLVKFAVKSILIIFKTEY